MLTSIAGLSSRCLYIASRSRWLLHFYLLALENSTFACPENESYLIGFSLSEQPSTNRLGKVLVCPLPHFPPPERQAKA